MIHALARINLSFVFKRTKVCQVWEPSAIRNTCTGDYESEGTQFVTSQHVLLATIWRKAKIVAETSIAPKTLLSLYSKQKQNDVSTLHQAYDYSVQGWNIHLTSHTVRN